MTETEAVVRNWLLTQPIGGPERRPETRLPDRERRMRDTPGRPAVDRALRANAGRVTLEAVARELGKPIPLPKAEEMRISGSLTALGLTKRQATVWKPSTPGAVWPGAADHQRRSATPTAR